MATININNIDTDTDEDSFDDDKNDNNNQKEKKSSSSSTSSSSAAVPTGNASSSSSTTATTTTTSTAADVADVVVLGDHDGEIRLLMQSMEDGTDGEKVTSSNIITPNIRRALSDLAEQKLESSLPVVEIDSEENHVESNTTIITTTTTTTNQADGAATTQQKDTTKPTVNHGSSIHPSLPSSLLSSEVCYGHPLTPAEASKRIPREDDGGGLHWHALLINGNPFDETTGQLKKGLNPRDFDLETQSIKPYRANLPILADDFYASLTRIDDNEVDDNDGKKLPPRFIFHGILNGWPSLQTLEVIRIQRRRDKESWRPSALMTGQRVWTHLWSSSQEGAKGIDPIVKGKGFLFRITFRGPSWTVRGWSPESPGFAFWYEPQNAIEGNNNNDNDNDGDGDEDQDGEEKVESSSENFATFSYGTEMIERMSRPNNPALHSKCTYVHMVAHRYGKLRENPKDKFTYHSVVLLEWDHGKYCSVIEAAYLNGLGGYRGKSNFFHDLNSPMTQLYKSFPPELVCPWLTNAAEIRAFDCPHIKSFDDFKSYISQYTGHDRRFLDPQYPFSHPARLTYRTKRDIAQYLNNYIRRDITYSELTRNCQTLSADLCAFLAGKREVLPYHPVNRIEYRNRTHLFLYEPEAYESKSVQQSRKGSFLIR